MDDDDDDASSSRTEMVQAFVPSQVRPTESIEVDVLDPKASTEQIAQLAKRTGGIDVVVNATSFMHDQGTEIDDLSLQEFLQGVTPQRGIVR